MNQYTMSTKAITVHPQRQMTLAISRARLSRAALDAVSWAGASGTSGLLFSRM